MYTLHLFRVVLKNKAWRKGCAGIIASNIGCHSILPDYCKKSKGQMDNYSCRVSLWCGEEVSSEGDEITFFSGLWTVFVKLHHQYGSMSHKPFGTWLWNLLVCFLLFLFLFFIFFLKERKEKLHFSFGGKHRRTWAELNLLRNVCWQTCWRNTYY